MNKQDPETIKSQVKQQRHFFWSGETRSIQFRLNQLRKLKQTLKNNEQRFFDALKQDLQRTSFETYGTELGLIYEEINLVTKKLKKWSRPQKVSGSLFNFPSRNYIYPKPYGVCLVIGAWNYPILLALHPVISAIAAGNTVVLKPSEIARHTSHLLNEIVTSTFPPEFFTVFEGGAETAQTILDQRLDYIFYTGSKRVGKLVMHAAAQQLTPVTLELGGKSPAIIDQTADLDIAAKRIAWGKFLNAGQTCVAPDYLLVEESIKEKLLKKMKGTITRFYGEDPSQNNDYPGIINESHFDRLVNLLENETTASGGQSDREKLYIAPTILDNRSWDDPIMQEEIFGPILPVITFTELDEITDKINARSTPLALYLFTSDKTAERRVIQQIEFGGGCINDTVVHLGNLNLPFGGKGSSGMGSYHGKSGFDTFSYPKSILKKPTWIDIPFRYAPYSGKLKWLKKIFN